MENKELEQDKVKIRFYLTQLEERIKECVSAMILFAPTPEVLKDGVKVVENMLNLKHHGDVRFSMTCKGYDVNVKMSLKNRIDVKELLMRGSKEHIRKGV
jgi:hypothetical protein